MLNAEKRDPPSRVANAPPGEPRGFYAMSQAEREQRQALEHLAQRPRPAPGSGAPAQHWLGLLRFVMSLPPQVRDLLLRQWFAPSQPGRIGPRNEP